MEDGPDLRNHRVEPLCRRHYVPGLNSRQVRHRHPSLTGQSPKTQPCCLPEKSESNARVVCFPHGKHSTPDFPPEQRDSLDVSLRSDKWETSRYLRRMDRAARLELGRRIKAKMDADDVSREEVLEGLSALGITVSLKTISNIRQGRHPGEVETLLGIAKVLDIDVTPDPSAADEDDFDEPGLVSEYEKISQDYVVARAKVIGLKAQLDTLRYHVEAEANQILDEWSRDPRARTTREFADSVIERFVEKRAEQGDQDPDVTAPIIRSAMAQIALKERAEIEAESGPSNVAPLRPRITSRSRIREDAALAGYSAIEEFFPESARRQTGLDLSVDEDARAARQTGRASGKSQKAREAQDRAGEPEPNDPNDFSGA